MESNRLPLLIVADKEDAKSYRSLQLPEERTTMLDLGSCVDLVKQAKAGVVLLDCGQRVWTGLTALRQIKQACPDVIVLFLTDQGSEDIAINAFSEGAGEYFKKPVNLYELRQALERLTAARRASNGERQAAFVRKGEDGVSCTQMVTTGKPQNLLQVIAFIEENLWSSMELESLAKKAHLSKFHFCRVFKRHIGMNPMKFVAALRIERAKELLAKNDKTVSIVANEVGFRDLSNFIRQFKKVTGVTPTMYRDMARSGEAAVN